MMRLTGELVEARRRRLALLEEIDGMPAHKRGSRWEADRLAELSATDREIERLIRSAMRVLLYHTTP
jgi:hypothetical protein